MALSFAIQRPKARPAAFANSDDEDAAPARDELISELGKRTSKPAAAPALTIPSQPNKDWKAEAQKLRSLARKTQTYLPVSQEKRTVVPDASADRIVDKTVGGLAVATPRSGTATPTTELALEIASATLDSPAATPAPQTDDELALRELLRGGDDAAEDESIDTISVAADSFNFRKTNTNEDDLFKHDVRSRPDSATLDDYARIPVEQFGAALLRGMSSSSSLARPTKTEAYIPKARPSLLGIGAKALEMPEAGASKRQVSEREKAIKRREEMHFVPLVKRKIEPKPATDALLMPPPPPAPASSNGTPNRRRRSPSPSSDHSAKRHRRRERSYSPDESSRRRSREDDYHSSSRSGRRERERSRSPERVRRRREDSPERRRDGGERRYESSRDKRRD